MKVTLGVHACIAIILIGVTFSSKSQSIFTTKPVDTTYIDPSPSVWSFRLYTVTKRLHFNLVNTAAQEKILYIPDPKLSIGIGASYKELLLDLGITFNTTSKDDTIEKSKSLDILGSIYVRRYLLDVSFQLYRGFNIDTVNKLPYLSFRNDIRTFNLGFHYSYLFNYTKLTAASSFMGTQIQKRSAGSPMAGVFLTYFDLRAEDDIVPPEVEGLFNEKAKFSEANLVSGGLTIGYMYTWVLPKHLFITLSVNPGISLNIGDLKAGSYYTTGYPPSITFKWLTRNAAGYNGKKIYCYFSYLADYNFVNLRSGNRLDYSQLKAKLVLGHRFGFEKQ